MKRQAPHSRPPTPRENRGSLPSLSPRIDGLGPPRGKAEKGRRSRHSLRFRVASVGSLVVVIGCGGALGPVHRPGSSSPHGPLAGDSSRLVPPGFGTLRQDDVTLSLRADDLLIKVVPLEEWVLRLTAPDTYSRLKNLAEAHRSSAVAAAGGIAVSLFLVTLFSYAPDVTYHPEDLLVVNRGLRYRPLAILPVTPGWGLQRLAQTETRMAVYAFEGGMDLSGELVVEYQTLQNESWAGRILPLLEAELPRARARAGGG